MDDSIKSELDVVGSTKETANEKYKEQETKEEEYKYALYFENTKKIITCVLAHLHFVSSLVLYRHYNSKGRHHDKMS